MSPLRLACLALVGCGSLGAAAGPARAAPFALVCAFTTADEMVERVTLVFDGLVSGPVAVGEPGSGRVPVAAVQLGRAELRTAADAPVGPTFDLTVARAFDAEGDLTGLVSNDSGAVVKIVEVATDLPAGKDGYHSIMSKFGEGLVGTCRA